MEDFKIDTGFSLEEDTLAQMKHDHDLSWQAKVTHKYRIEKAKADRLEKGLKPNRITSYELRLVIEDWLINGRGVIQKSFNKVYSSTGKLNKEVDWCDRIPKSKYFSRELESALFSSKHKDVILFVNSKLFESYSCSANKALTTRIHDMDIVLAFEEEMMRKEDELTKALAKIEQLEGNKTWEQVATELLEAKVKQQEVANTVGKSIATIRRLAKKLKENNK